MNVKLNMVWGRCVHKLTYVQPACGVAYINLTICVALFVALLMFSVGFAFPVVYSLTCC